MRSRDAPPSTSMSSPSDRGSRASFLEGPYLRVGCPFRRTAALLTPGTVAPRSRRAATIRSAPTPRAYAICWSLWACAGLTERIALVASGGLGHGVSFALRAATLPGAELALRIASTFTPRWLMNLGRRMGRALPSISPADLDRDMVIPIAHTLAAHDLLPTSTLEIFGGAGHFPHVEQPLRFAHLLHDFLATPRPPASTRSPCAADCWATAPNSPDHGSFPTVGTGSSSPSRRPALLRGSAVDL